MPWGFAAAGVASGVAGAAASSAGGKKGSKQSRSSEGLSNEQANAARTAQQLAVEQSSLTKPLRSQTVRTLDDFLYSGGQTPKFLDLNPQVAGTAHLATLGIPGIEAQQAGMRRQLQASGVRGGQMNQAMGMAGIQAGLQRASNLQAFQHDDIMRQEARDTDRARLRQTLFGAATDLGTGGMTQAQQGINSSMSGLGGAAANMNSLGGQAIMQNMQTQQALGSLAGKGVGYGAGQTLPAYGQGTLGAQKGGAARPMGGAAPVGGK
jgi:hypothetical protein